MRDEPSSAELLVDPNVIAAMREAFDESDVGGPIPIEQGGFILSDPQTGGLQVERLPPAGRDSLTYPICSDGRYNGKLIVGTFHTHPNTGPDWTQEPSRQDIQLSKQFPETMGRHQFVVSVETIYHIDNDGVVSEAGRTGELLGLERED
jgi:hypothetical protein